MNIDIDKVDIEILFLLFTKDKTSPLYSMQIKTIQDELSTKLSYYTIVRRVQILIEKGYVSLGYKVRNANTFYILPKGVEFIETNIIEKENVCVDLDNNGEVE